MSREQTVRDVAYAIWEAEGKPPGRDALHWRLAEERVAASLAGVRPDTAMAGKAASKPAVAKARSPAKAPAAAKAKISPAAKAAPKAKT